MSRMRIHTHGTEVFTMNVLQFRSPMSAQIDSVQTRTMQQHFPIRAGQPDIQFTVRFASLDEKDKFESFVRRHQLNALEDKYANITLWWPERNISNWTGYIMNYRVAVRRFDYAPAVTFGVSLMDSMMSYRTFISSSSPGFESIYGPQIAPYVDFWRDGILNLPSLIRNAEQRQIDSFRRQQPTEEEGQS